MGEDDEDVLAELLLLASGRVTSHRGGDGEGRVVDLGVLSREWSVAIPSVQVNCTHVHVQVTTKDSPEDTFEGGHAGTIDSSSYEPANVVPSVLILIPQDSLLSLEVKAASVSLVDTRGLYVSEEGRRGLIEARPDLVSPVAGLTEEDVRLPQHLARLLELERSLLEGFVGRVHGRDALLALLESPIELLQRRASVSAGEEGNVVLVGSDSDLLRADLRGQEAESSLSLVAASNLGR